MRLYQDPRPASLKLRPNSLPNLTDSDAKCQVLPPSPGAASNGSGSRMGRSGRSRPKAVFDSDDDLIKPTPEEMELLLQLRKAKLDMARAESEYLATLLESERGRNSRSMSTGSHSRQSSRPPLKKIIEEDKLKDRAAEVTYESASDVSSYSATAEPDQMAGLAVTERNPFRTDGVIIDSDDDFLGHAVQRRAPPLTALYVDPDERKSKISKLKSRFKRLFRKSPDYN